MRRTAPAIHGLRLFIRARSWYLPDGSSGLNPRSNPFDTPSVDGWFRPPYPPAWSAGFGTFSSDFFFGFWAIPSVFVTPGL